MSILSPSAYVVVNSLLSDIVLGVTPAQVILLADRRANYEKVRERLSSLVRLWTGISPQVDVYVCNILSTNDVKRISKLVDENTIINLTAGRKIQAMILHALAMSKGAKARYVLIVDERRYGYKPFGVAPFPAIKPLELEDTSWRTLSWRYPTIRPYGEDVELDEEELKAFMNFMSLKHEHFKIFMKYHGIVEELLDIQVKGLEAKIHIATEDKQLMEHILYSLEASGILSPANMHQVLVEVRDLLKQGYSIFPDTNVFIMRRISWLEEALGHEVLDHILLPRVVYNELFRLSELKGRHTPEKGRLMIGFHEYTKLMMKTEKEPPRDEKFASARGDRYLIDEIRARTSPALRPFLLTEDRALSTMAKRMGIKTVFIEPPTLPGEAVECNVDKIPVLMWLLASVLGSIHLKVGLHDIILKTGWPRSIKVVMTGDDAAKGLARLVRKTIEMEKELQEELDLIMRS